MTQQDTQPPAETLAEAMHCALKDAAAIATAEADRLAKEMPMGSRSEGTARAIAADIARLAVAALTRRAGGDAIPAGEEWPVKWAGPLTVGNMIANLRTLPADMPIHSAYHLVREGKPARLFVKHPTVSRERVDGREIKTGDESVPYSAVIWSHGREPEIATPKPPAGGDEWSMVNRLRDQEADSVEILCDNPDGDPNNAIVCCGFWTGFVERRFSGDTIADALRSAVKAKDQADRDGHPDVSPAGGDAGAVERAYRQGQIDMRDRAAAVCDERGAEEQEGYGLNRAAQNYFRARNAVRALEPAAVALPAPAGGDAGAVDLAALIEPWKDHHGPLPDYDSPIACVFDAGVQYAVELLAKELGVTEWTPCDGTEEYDGDLGGTLMNIVCEAMPFDQDGERMRPSDLAAALALPAPVVEEDVEKEARFLCDRLAEFEREITDDDQFTQFNGHVAPSAARLRAALSEGRSHG